MADNVLTLMSVTSLENVMPMPLVKILSVAYVFVNRVTLWLTNATSGNCENIIECMAPNKCNEHACDDTCDETVGSYTYTCLNDWTGDGESCADVNECDYGSNKCSVDGTCTHTDGSYTCACNDVFNGDGFECPDIHECDNDPCGFNIVRINTHGAFECECVIDCESDAMIGCSDIDACATEKKRIR